MFLKPLEFAEKTNLPLKLVRRMCLKNQIPNIKSGNKYFIEADGAEKVIKEMASAPLKKESTDYIGNLRKLRKELKYAV